MQPQAAMRFHLQGRVQGVGFRYSTRHMALKLGLTGYVRNKNDGGVEVVACGDAQCLQQLQQWLQAGGPPAARVDSCISQPYHDQATAQHTELFHDFTIRY